MSRGLRIAALAIGFGVPTLLVHSLQRQHTRALVDAEIRATNTARALKEHAEPTFEIIDTYLRAVISLVGPRADALPKPALHAALAEQFARSRGLRNIVLIDREGIAVVEAAAYPTRPLDVRDRDYFRALRDHATGGLAIGQPIVGSLTGTPVLPVARRIDGPDGSFAGIIQAVIDPQTFQGVYEAIDNGPGAVLSLWRADGTLLVRSPSKPGTVGRNYAGNANYRNHVAPRDTKPFWSTGSTDGMERVLAIGFLDGPPIYVGAALGRDDVLADWRRSALTQAAGGGGLALVLVAALLLLAREIERRQVADTRIRASEARYRTLAENTSDVITRLDLAFRRTYVSPSCQRLFGHTPEEMLGDQPSASIHPDDAPAVREAARQLATGHILGDQAVTTYRARHSFGHWIWIEAVLSLVRDAAGAPASIVCVLRDAGARKADEAVLVQAREAAEAAQARAEAADRAKGEFLATMSHEIRTPLNAIKGFNELLADDDGLSAGQRRYVERVQVACQLLTAVVDDILDYARIEAGGVALETAPFAPWGLVADTTAMVRGLAEAKGLELAAQVSPDLPRWLAGDATRLRQVLINLLNNAIKFTPAGVVTVTVAWAETEGGGRLRVAVRDTGIGIPTEAQARLFIRFSQADGSTTRRFGGSGLGLAICKGLIEAMGGEIGLVSEAGAGSIFHFEVPLALAKAPCPPPRPALSSTAPSAASGGSRGRLLLVDDEETNREIGRAVLEQAGYEVDLARDGLEAFGAVLAKTYDLVLMDAQMPEMDGPTATRAIRALAHPTHRVPIVAMTANVLPQQVAQLRAAGMDDHVGKPFERGQLFAAIERWIGRDASGMPTERRSPASAPRAIGL